MYFMIRCLSPVDSEPSLLTYEPERLPDGALRSWKSGKRFAVPPGTPIPITVEEGESGALLEFYNATIALMSRRLAKVLLDAGISNVDFYETEIHDLQTGETHRDHLAFNVVGAIAAADLRQSQYSAVDGPMTSVDFASLVIDPEKARGALLFRLAESVNGIVVHQSVRKAIEAAGIDTLTFLAPEEWVG